MELGTMLRKSGYVLTVLLVSTAVLQGCATTPSEQRLTQTSSGSPEVVISNTSRDEIRAKIINEMLANGWQVTSDYGANFSFTKPMSSARAAGERFADSLISGKKGGEYTDEAVFSIVDANGSFRVIGRLNTISNYPGGQARKTQNSSVELYNLFQKYLFSVRDSLKR